MTQLVRRIADLPAGVREALRERGVTDAAAGHMTPKEIFGEYCTWNGLINWSDTLWDAVVALQGFEPEAARRHVD